MITFYVMGKGGKAFRTAVEDVAGVDGHLSRQARDLPERLDDGECRYGHDDHIGTCGVAAVTVERGDCVACGRPHLGEPPANPTPSDDRAVHGGFRPPFDRPGGCRRGAQCGATMAPMSSPCEVTSVLRGRLSPVTSRSRTDDEALSGAGSHGKEDERGHDALRSKGVELWVLSGGRRRTCRKRSVDPPPPFRNMVRRRGRS